MPVNRQVRIGSLKESELAEADRIVRVAFGTFLGLPNPQGFMDDRNFMTPRWRSRHVKVIAAREGGRLVGSNVITRWGSFASFGPLTVLPEYWNRGVAQRLMESTMTTFEKWGVRHTGLFTFASSPKHVGLYQKFGYWPRSLTAIMTRTPESEKAGSQAGSLLSSMDKSCRERTIEACRRLTGRIDKGLDLSGEIREVLAQRTGEIVVTQTRGVPDAFAVCLHGPGSEGGSKTCYIKFAAARGSEQFVKLLRACESFAASRNAAIEAGVSMACESAFRRMRDLGYRTTILGVTMHRPNADGFTREDTFVLGDWR